MKRAKSKSPEKSVKLESSSPYLQNWAIRVWNDHISTVNLLSEDLVTFYLSKTNLKYIFKIPTLCVAPCEVYIRASYFS